MKWFRFRTRQDELFSSGDFNKIFEVVSWRWRTPDPEHKTLKLASPPSPNFKLSRYERSTQTPNPNIRFFSLISRPQHVQGPLNRITCRLKQWLWNSINGAERSTIGVPRISLVNDTLAEKVCKPTWDFPLAWLQSLIQAPRCVGSINKIKSRPAKATPTESAKGR